MRQVVKEVLERKEEANTETAISALCKDNCPHSSGLCQNKSTFLNYYYHIIISFNNLKTERL